MKNHSFTVMFLPSDTSRQRVEDVKIGIRDCLKYSDTYDNFNNKKIYGYIARPHNEFKVRISGTVETGLDIFEEYTDDSYKYSIFKTQTALTAPGEKLKDYHKSLELENLDGPYDKAVYIMNTLRFAILYNKGVTEVHETAENAFALGKGVCQDYAHIMLSLLRMEGIAARYVVGMTLGEGASHAWVEALCNGYWYGFDPTNNKLVNDEYIRVSCGRDSSDCSVIRGSFFGFAEQKQTEEVTVEEI